MSSASNFSNNSIDPIPVAIQNGDAGSSIAKTYGLPIGLIETDNSIAGAITTFTFYGRVDASRPLKQVLDDAGLPITITGIAANKIYTIDYNLLRGFNEILVEANTPQTGGDTVIYLKPVVG